jgi:hypothetical protein
MSKLFYLIKKMLGMTSLMLAVMAVFTPILTIYLIWFSIFMAGFAGLTGSLVFSAIAIMINVVNLVFLSPISLALVGGNFFSMIITLFVFIISISVWGFGLKLKFSGLAEAIEKEH